MAEFVAGAAHPPADHRVRILRPCVQPLFQIGGRGRQDEHADDIDPCLLAQLLGALQFDVERLILSRRQRSFDRRARHAGTARELFEEAGVLLVRNAAGQLLSVDASDTSLQERLESTRLALQARELSISGVLREHGWRPALDLLVPFSHWITPRAVSARFDTRFFVAELPAGQSALHDTIETSEGIWLTPARALEPDYQTVYPTQQHLLRLARFQTVSDLLSFARDKPIRMVSPTILGDGSQRRLEIRPDIAHAW